MPAILVVEDAQASCSRQMGTDPCSMSTRSSRRSASVAEPFARKGGVSHHVRGGEPASLLSSGAQQTRSCRIEDFVFSLPKLLRAASRGSNPIARINRTCGSHAGAPGQDRPIFIAQPLSSTTPNISTELECTLSQVRHCSAMRRCLENPFQGFSDRPTKLVRRKRRKGE